MVQYTETRLLPLSASVSTLKTLQPGWGAAPDSRVFLVQTDSLEICLGQT